MNEQWQYYNYAKFKINFRKIFKLSNMIITYI